VRSADGYPRRLRLLWLSAWPLWTLLVLLSLAAVRQLPGGYLRAAVAAPIVLMVPGALTLGAFFSSRHRPQGTTFVSYSAVLSAVWAGFASLALYFGHLLITASSTYWCLLIISVALAVGAEARLLLGRGSGRRVARKFEDPDPGVHDIEADDAETAASPRAAGYYAAVAVLAGIGLLAGSLYAYDHLPRPVPVGYTWMAWTGPPITGDIAVGSSGTKVGFKIVHRQSETTSFRLTAAWLGSSSRPLAKPLNLSIGPDKTFRAALFIPPLSNGCTYRIVVALTATRQMDPQTNRLRTWSINADVHDPGKPRKACG
jgi:hypothetical protein